MMFQVCLLALLLPVGVLSHCKQFGMMQSLAVPIYEVDIYINRSDLFVDVEFKQQGNLVFNINLILVIDEGHVEWMGWASILAGGIGWNFTTLRLVNIQPEVARVTVLIYGLPRGSPVVPVIRQIAAY